MSYCWSCQHAMKDGISLDGSDTQHVCDKCWAKLPIQWRLIVTKWFRDDLKQPTSVDDLFFGDSSQN